MADSSELEARQQVELLTQRLQMMELMLSLAQGNHKFGDPVDEVYFIRHYNDEVYQLFVNGRFQYCRRPTLDNEEIALLKKDVEDKEAQEKQQAVRRVMDGLNLLKSLTGGERILTTINNLPLAVIDGDTPRNTGSWSVLKRPFSKSIWLVQTERKDKDSATSSLEGSEPLHIPTVYVPPEFQDVVYPDCRVLLDESNRMVVYVQPVSTIKESRRAARYAVSETNVSWDDIGGLSAIRDWFITNLKLPYESPDLFKKYGLGLPKGALLAGPPGNGKSLIAKAIATDLSKMHGKAGFFAINGPELLNCFVGETERAIRDLFSAANEFYEENKYPAIVFIDEADAILGKRGSGVSTDIDKTIVPTFLTCMDGMRAATAFILLATNRPDILDPAVVREGRIDRKLIVPRPTAESAEHIFTIHLSKTLVKDDVTNLAKRASEALFNPALVIKDVTASNGSSHSFLLSDVASGALIASIVMEAGRKAAFQDIASKRSPTGLVWEDLRVSILQHVQSNTILDHTAALKEWAAAKGIDIAEATTHTYV